MSDGAIALKEATVKSDKVHKHGDTLSYIVGAYANRAHQREFAG